MKSDPAQRRRILLIVLLVLVPALFFLAWSQASLNLSFIRPSNSEQTILLLVLSTVIFLAFLIFALILLRILLKLYVERQQQQLGSRFKTKMVVAFLGVSLVPVCFLFAFAYGLLNRTIDRWFSAPLDLIRQDSEELVRQLEMATQQRADHISSDLAQSDELIQATDHRNFALVTQLLARELAPDPGNAAALCFDPSGKVLAQAGAPWSGVAALSRHFPQILSGTVPAHGLTGHWASGDFRVFISLTPMLNAAGAPLGTVAGVTLLPAKLSMISSEIQREAEKYDELSRERKAVKRNYLSMLWLLTLLILFIATWFAFFFSKQVTIPIQALAKATHNSVAIDMYRVINAVRRREHSNWTRIYASDQPAERRKLFVKEHNEIFDALAARDGRAAREAWSNHLRNTKRRMLDL